MNTQHHLVILGKFFFFTDLFNTFVDLGNVFTKSFLVHLFDLFVFIHQTGTISFNLIRELNLTFDPDHIFGIQNSLNRSFAIDINPYSSRNFKLICSQIYFTIFHLLLSQNSQTRFTRHLGQQFYSSVQSFYFSPYFYRITIACTEQKCGKY